MPSYDSVDYDPPAPIARVTLRAPRGTTVSDVHLLIDTGADTTLLPRSAVARLGIHLDPALQYDLIGFDGNRTTTLAADLDMIFLGKAFRGRHLVIDGLAASLAAMFWRASPCFSMDPHRNGRSRHPSPEQGGRYAPVGRS